jgi:hypothetical protein
LEFGSAESAKSDLLYLLVILPGPSAGAEVARRRRSAKYLMAISI